MEELRNSNSFEEDQDGDEMNEEKKNEGGEKQIPNLNDGQIEEA